MIETVEYEFRRGAWVPVRSWYRAECGHVHSREVVPGRTARRLVEYELAGVEQSWGGDALAARSAS